MSFTSIDLARVNHDALLVEADKSSRRTPVAAPVGTTVQEGRAGQPQGRPGRQPSPPRSRARHLAAT
jgi:hypothetical protein